MLKSHDKFHSANGKRQILVADDEGINREILYQILEKDYEVVMAENGREALEMIREMKDTLSLVLLDVLMPLMTGLDVLKEVRRDPATAGVPVIVVTSEQNAEAESLQLGANDFIPKPYPAVDVILARVQRTIELSEDRDIIRSTERDALTGLYNREYFYRYGQQYDQFHKDIPTDAVVVNINHFHLINERYGKAYGDDVLRHIGIIVRDMVRDSGGIVSRQDADNFMIYCPHRDDYESILENASTVLAEESHMNSRVRLRMGIYENVDKRIDIERRFDRAKMAADAVRSNFIKSIAIYDNVLHEKEIFNEHLLEDFQEAMKEHQFRVFFQPKYDIRYERPMLASAEALVRWKHPRLGMISPGIFIPLFEENGLIQRLDHYVWRSAAAQVRAWKDQYGISVPVSVNVSRIDMYDSDLVGIFRSILEEYQIAPEDLMLEITESAYTQDSEQIIGTVNKLRELGFLIEMDDFGTGYSSLNMISNLPIDALKLDMKFIRDAFRDGRDTRMIEVIIDIADYLAVPVIAEGVETEEQLKALKSMGCDLVQGYYFSRPVPPEEYVLFIEEKKQRLTRNADPSEAVIEHELKASERAMPSTIAYALTSGFEVIYYVDTTTGRYVEFSARGKYRDLRIEQSGTDFFGDTQKNIPRVVYSEDQSMVSRAMRREELLGQLVGDQAFTMKYRLMIEGKPELYNLIAVRALARDNHHIVIGVSNVESRTEREQELEKSQQERVTYSGIAQALAADYFSIYYVNVVTDEFIEFSSHEDYESLGIEKFGEDFFGLSRKNILRVVHPDDHDKILNAFTKERLLDEMDKTGTFTLEYRLMFDGKPSYVSMKASRMANGDRDHIVIGVNNIDAQVQRQKEFDKAKERSDTFFRISRALAKDYYSIYLVNIETDEFIEYASSQDFRELKVEQSGVDFFSDCRRNVMRLVYKDDLDKALAVWDKSRLIPELKDGKTISTTYRLMFDDTPVYINCKVIRMDDEDNQQYIVIGVSNVDEQIRREQELAAARDRANRDAMTGVKSKHAYMDDVDKINMDITAGTVQPFAVAVCDVNGLKTVNDTQGHQAGDKLIRDASHIICNIFKHSPVYRTGGDEFVVIMRGQDYERQDRLLESMKDTNSRNRESGGVIIACGSSRWNEVSDESYESVFDRADAEMYSNKAQLKASETV